MTPFKITPPSIHELDDLFRAYIHKKYPHPVCFVCEKVSGWFHPKTNPRGCQIGHVFSRQVFSLRWNEKNIEPQCSRCNATHQKNPSLFEKKIIARYGYRRLVFLRTLAKQDRAAVFHRKSFLCQVKKRLENQIKTLS